MIHLRLRIGSQVIQLFSKFDTNDDGCISMEDAEKFWAKSWARVNAHAMFNEVDDDRNGQVTQSEWLDFWRNVVAQPEYTEEEVEEEVDNMLLHNGSWVDWNDGRTT
jgi:Ca2+-binding EF-hand superfamily protein